RNPALTFDPITENQPERAEVWNLLNASTGQTVENRDHAQTASQCWRRSRENDVERELLKRSNILAPVLEASRILRRRQSVGPGRFPIHGGHAVETHAGRISEQLALVKDLVVN